MSYHVLKQDLPKGHTKGNLIQIPEEESSYLIKGKGYFIQIFRDSDLLYPCYPQYFFTPVELKFINGSDYSPSVKEPFLKWEDLHILMTLKECEDMELPYGTYKCSTKLGGYAHYDYLSQLSTMISIDVHEENLIQSGDLIVRVCSDGRRIKGIAVANREYINTSGPFNRFCCIEDLYTHGVARNVYGTGIKNTFFYQRMVQDELNAEDINYIESLIDHKNGEKGNLKIDMDNLRIVEDDEKK